MSVARSRTKLPDADVGSSNRAVGVDAEDSGPAVAAGAEPRLTAA
jgi:hypothetical protein